MVITLVADVAQSISRSGNWISGFRSRRTRLRPKATYELFRERQKGGVASDLEVARRKRICMRPRPRSGIQASDLDPENRICFLLARNPGPIDRGLSIENQASLPPVPAAGLPSDLLRRRPDVIASEYLVKSANAIVGSRMAEFLPKLDLVNFIGGEGRRPSDIWGDKTDAWTIGGETKLPLFHGGRNIFSYRSAQAQWRQAVEQYQKTVVNAFTDVANALTDIKRLAEVRAAQELQVKSDRYAAKLAKTRYEGGYSSYLEVLDAERRRYAAEDLLAKTIGNQFVSLSNLYRALGGGWQAEEVRK